MVDKGRWDAIEAAHRALHAVLIEGKPARRVQADIAAAGPAFVGVLNAFFRNVMERPFSGHEDVGTVQAYLERLKAAHPDGLAVLQPYPMALFVLEQIGPGALPPGSSRMFPLEGGVLFQMRLLAEHTAGWEGIVGEELERCLSGACARYYTGEY